jgi:hypothetical protein
MRLKLSFSCALTEKKVYSAVEHDLLTDKVRAQLGEKEVKVKTKDCVVSFSWEYG